LCGWSVEKRVQRGNFLVPADDLICCHLASIVTGRCAKISLSESSASAQPVLAALVEQVPARDELVSC
jgi:hypothetical protein